MQGFSDVRFSFHASTPKTHVARFRGTPAKRPKVMSLRADATHGAVSPAFATLVVAAAYLL